MAAVSLGVGNRMYDNGLVPVRQIDEIQLDMMTMRRDMLNHITAQDAAAITEYEKVIKDRDAAMAAHLAAYAKDTHAPALLAELRQAWTIYIQHRDEMLLPASRRHDVAEVDRVRRQVTRPEANRADDVLRKITIKETAEAKRSKAATNTAYDSGRRWAAPVLVSGLLVALSFAIVVRSIKNSVQRVSTAVSAIARRDLTHTTELVGRDEFCDMGRGLDEAVDAVRTTVRDLALTRRGCSLRPPANWRRSATISTPARQQPRIGPAPRRAPPTISTRACRR